MSKVKLQKNAPNNVSKNSECHLDHLHPDHSLELIKLKRAVGQLEGVRKMIEERRYCPEILIQVRAVSKAISSIEKSILKTHLKACVKDAMKEKQNKKVDEKISELIEILDRHSS
jgi:CsoR family transcriptional regulator, copper-sensing transcriptional repressor